MVAERLPAVPLTMLQVTTLLNGAIPITLAVSMVLVAGKTVVEAALMVTAVTPGVALMP